MKIFVSICSSYLKDHSITLYVIVMFAHLLCQLLTLFKALHVSVVPYKFRFLSIYFRC